VKISSIRKEPMYAKVVNQFRQALETGELAPGEKLPTEASLASRFQVSRVVIREALSALKVLGLRGGKVLVVSCGIRPCRDPWSGIALLA
jgi:DNA-binding FadR family transcriptional regulator